MAQPNIIDSLFGPTPYDVGQARNQQDMSYAEKVARMGGFEQAKFGIGQGAAGLTRAGAGMMGMVDPMQQEAARREQVMAQGDMDMSSKGLLLKVQQLKDAGNYQDARRFAMAAQVQKEKEDSALLAANKDARQEKHETYLQGQAHELKLLTLQAQRDRDRAASEDRRFSTEERAIASRRADATDRMIAQMQVDSRRAAAEAKASEPKPISRVDAMSIDKSLAASSGANGAMQLLDQADALYGKYASGRDEPILGGAARWGAAVGLADPKRAADYEVAGQIAKDLGVIKLGLIGGSDTERELQVAIDTSPSPDKLPSTNRTIIANQRRAIQVLQAEPDFKTEWVNKNGSLSKLDKETGDTYGKAWRKYQQANFKPVVNPGAAGTTSTATQSNADKIPTGVPTGRTFKVLGKEPQ